VTFSVVGNLEEVVGRGGGRNGDSSLANLAILRSFVLCKLCAMDSRGAADRNAKKRRKHWNARRYIYERTDSIFSSTLFVFRCEISVFTMLSLREIKCFLSVMRNSFRDVLSDRLRCSAFLVLSLIVTNIS